MNRRELQQLSDLRVREARVLLDNECYPGAYYLLGYAVECALKACIAKRVGRHDFPDRRLAIDSYTHDLGTLLRVANLDVEMNQEISDNHALDANWAIVRDWSVDSRYSY